MLKIPVQYVISETEDQEDNSSTKDKGIARKRSSHRSTRSIGSMQRVNTSSPREGGVPFPMVELLLVCFAEESARYPIPLS